MQSDLIISIKCNDFKVKGPPGKIFTSNGYSK